MREVVCRTWHGWTTAANADAYQRLLLGEVIPGILARRIPGFRRIEAQRRPLPSGEIEFTTLMWFDSLDAVRAFVGEDYEAAYVPPAARAVLARFDARVTHATVLDEGFLNGK